MMSGSIDYRAVFIGLAAMVFLVQNPSLTNAQRKAPRLPATFTQNGHLANPCVAGEMRPVMQSERGADPMVTGSISPPVGGQGCR